MENDHILYVVPFIQITKYSIISIVSSFPLLLQILVQNIRCHEYLHKVFVLHQRLFRKIMTKSVLNLEIPYIDVLWENQRDIKFGVAKLDCDLVLF